MLRRIVWSSCVRRFSAIVIVLSMGIAFDAIPSVALAHNNGPDDAVRRAVLEVRIEPSSLARMALGEVPQAFSPERSEQVTGPGGEVIFASNRAGSHDIYMQHGDGSDAGTPIVTGTSEDVTPSWSPDGGEVIFASNRDGDYEIYLRRAGGELGKLTDNQADDAHPAWSPNGERIIFTSNRGGDYFQIYTMRPDGSDVRQVGQVPNNHAMHPRYSPDGTQIAYMRASSLAPVCTWNWDIWVMNADGSNQCRVTTQLLADMYPNWIWTPNGSAIVYASCRNVLDFDLYAVYPDSGTESRINNWFLSNEWEAVSSADGNYMAFNTDFDGNVEVYTFPVAGGAASNLTRNTAEDLSPSWTISGGTTTYSVSGRILEDGHPLAGVAFSLPSGQAAVTDTDGKYTLSGIRGGTYMLTPRKSGYAFTPPERSIIVPPDRDGVDFFARENVPPDGSITLPENGATLRSGGVEVIAVATDNEGGSGVERVAFHVAFDGVDHFIDEDAIAPYVTTWQTPGNLKSQQLRFSAVISDRAGNSAVGTGTSLVTYLESSSIAGVSENWVSKDRRAYLNQRSLSPSGDSKCSATSMSMVLAMNGLILSDYNTMANKANEMYPNVLWDGDAYVYRMRDELRRQGAVSEYYNDTVDDAWRRVMQEVDADRPVIVRSAEDAVTDAGHYMVAVGYREAGQSHQIITYDPYGHWLGTCCVDNYDKNEKTAESQKGRWVYYDFPTVYGTRNYLITASAPNRLSVAGASTAPATPPDEISVEPADIGTYSGVGVGDELPPGISTYLPLIKSR